MLKKRIKTLKIVKFECFLWYSLFKKGFFLVLLKVFQKFVQKVTKIHKTRKNVTFNRFLFEKLHYFV